MSCVFVLSVVGSCATDFTTFHAWLKSKVIRTASPSFPMLKFLVRRQRIFTILNQEAPLERPTFSQNLPCCDSGLPRDTQYGIVIEGNVFERPSAQEGLSFTIFNNSKNLAPSSQELRPETGGTSMRRESEMKRESLNTSILSLHFQSRSVLNHIGGIYSHNGMMDYPKNSHY